VLDKGLCWRNAQLLGRRPDGNVARFWPKGASALTASDLKKGVSAIATIGSTAPFVGLFGTVFGIINAFRGMKTKSPATRVAGLFLTT